MKSKKKYSGVVIPAVTPLTSNNKLDHEAVEKMFNHFYLSRAMPFIIGTTGESASLPYSLKLDYIKTAVKLKEKGTILYAGISSNCLEESVELAKEGFDAGVDVVAATLPSYYTLSESQMKRYFEQLAEQVPGPVIIYNIPATTHMSIPLTVIDELSHHENIVGTKDSERSEERLEQSLELWSKREDFSHFVGWAAKSAEALINGSDGIIPSSGNVSGGIYRIMVEAIEKGDNDTAYTYQKYSDEIGDLYQKGRTLGESLAALKVLMKELGFCQPYVMPPLQPLSPQEEDKLVKAYHSKYITEDIHLTDIYYDE
jgi:dihydrodipicolinate synthase/N-acetylneuraminate lyase